MDKENKELIRQMEHKSWFSFRNWFIVRVLKNKKISKVPKFLLELLLKCSLRWANYNFAKIFYVFESILENELNDLMWKKLIEW